MGQEGPVGNCRTTAGWQQCEPAGVAGDQNASLRNDKARFLKKPGLVEGTVAIEVATAYALRRV